MPIQHQVRALRTPGARQTGNQLENDFVITFSGDGTPIQLNPISIRLDSITGDLSNNGRVILGRAFADFLNDELSAEWAGNTEIADLTRVLVDVVKVETLSTSPANDLKEILATLDTTLTFDGLADAPDIGTVNEAVLKALLKMDKFLQDYLLTSGLDEFLSINNAEATMEVDQVTVVEKPPKTKPPKEDKDDGPAVAQANSAPVRSVSFDPADLKILIPATIGGLAMFLLTVFWLARNRKRQNLDVSYDSYDEDIDHTVNGSQAGKEEIEVQAHNLPGSTMDYGYHPDGHVDLNSSYGAGHVAMHIPAMDQSMASGRTGRSPGRGRGVSSPYRDNAGPPTSNDTRTPAQLYNRGSVIDSPSKGGSSVSNSEYSEGQYWS